MTTDMPRSIVTYVHRSKRPLRQKAQAAAITGCATMAAADARARSSCSPTSRVSAAGRCGGWCCWMMEGLLQVNSVAAWGGSHGGQRRRPAVSAWIASGGVPSVHKEAAPARMGTGAGGCSSARQRKATTGRWVTPLAAFSSRLPPLSLNWCRRRPNDSRRTGRCWWRSRQERERLLPATRPEL
jgi:hypothetical protein